MSLGGYAASITFGAPSIVGQAKYSTGFQGFGDGLHALGKAQDGWHGTADGGKSWKTIFQGTPGDLKCTDFPAGGTGSNEAKCKHGNTLQDGFQYVYNDGRGGASAICGEAANCWCCRCEEGDACSAPSPGPRIAGDTTAIVLSEDGKTMHNLGYVTSVADKDAEYTSFNSTAAGYFFVGPDGSFQYEERVTPLTFRGLPTPASCGDSGHSFGCPFRPSGRGYVRLPDGSLVMSIIIWWGGEHANPDPKLASKATSVVAFRSTGGLIWDYAGTIVDASQTPASEEGPNENDLALLADGETILCIVRLDAGDGPVSRPYRPYAKVTSSDGGRTWTNATLLPEGVGSARPRLLRLSDGQLVLTGGRPSPTNRDTTLWTNEAGDGQEWLPYSLSYWHNLLEPDDDLHFTPSINTSSVRQSTSYTSLIKTGDASGFVIYPQSLNGKDTAFAMPFSFGAPATAAIV